MLQKAVGACDIDTGQAAILTIHLLLHLMTCGLFMPTVIQAELA